MTLLETMIALLIFSIGIIGVGAMQVGSMHINTKARKATYDTVAASEYLEDILSLPYDDPLLSDSDNGFEPSTPDHGPFKIESTLSSIEWEIDDQFPIPNTKRIRITLRFGGSKGSIQPSTCEYVKIKGPV